MALTTFDRELYEQGLREEGELKTLLENVYSLQKNLNISLEEALSALGKTMKDYEKARAVKL